MHDDDDQHLEHHRLARLHRLVLIDLFEPHRSIRAITTQLVEQNRGAAPLKPNVEHWRAERDHRERMDAFPVAPWPGQLPAEEDTLAWGPINDLLQDMSIDVELDECRFEIIDFRPSIAGGCWPHGIRESSRRCRPLPAHHSHNAHRVSQCTLPECTGPCETIMMRTLTCNS